MEFAAAVQANKLAGVANRETHVLAEVKGVESTCPEHRRCAAVMASRRVRIIVQFRAAT
jgi:hypothetical protein